jgi:hypothetical protein
MVFCYGCSYLWGLTNKLPARMVFSGLASKSMTTISGGLPSKPAVTVSDGLPSKPAVMVSTYLTSKPVVGFLVEPQNQGGGGFPGWTSKPAALV